MKCHMLVIAASLAVCSCQSPPTGLPSNPKAPGTSSYLRDNAKDRVIVFVHGVLGDAGDTWTATNGAYWPKLLLDDPLFDDSDVYVYDYPSPLFARSYSIDELADNLRLELDNASLFQRHREVVFLCHSMGGLVVRQLLLKYQHLAKQVPMIYFFSTPTTGAEIAALAATATKLNRQFADMKPWHDGAYVGNLVRQWQAAQFKIKSYCAYEKPPTSGIQVVSEQSASNLCNQHLDPIAADHVTIVKPSNRSALPYLAFRNAIAATPLAPSTAPAAPAASPCVQKYITQPYTTEADGRISKSLTCPDGMVIIPGSPRCRRTSEGYGTLKRSEQVGSNTWVCEWDPQPVGVGLFVEMGCQCS